MSSSVWIELNSGNPEHNLSAIRSGHSFKGIHCAVVKSNAYGHGVREMAGLIPSADWLAVNSIDEGLELRALGEKRPVLLLGHVPLERLTEARDACLRFILCNSETLKEISRIPVSEKDFLLHMKVETGTWRQGVLPENACDLAGKACSIPGVKLEGIYTHFANIEDTLNHSYATEQLNTFLSVVSNLRKKGINPPVVHTACTAAAVLFPETHFSMLRTGIGMYGLWPSRETRLSAESSGVPLPDLRPVLAWKTRIVQVKNVPEGSYIGYGGTFRTTRETRLAVLPVGYADGYSRSIGNTGWVLINGKRASILGRVCMNLCMADITDIPNVSLEDEVVLLGSDGSEKISAELMARWAGTINYEVVTGISPLLPRKVR
ncbi:alanine racemase [Candidatus Fermentibacteria bacterium]|nr:MAG: alanine racemase [Candidatus Fermentibacteria bacterium]